MVPQAAQLRARNFIGAGGVRLEVKGDLHPRDDILFQSQLANKEIVDHIAGSKNQQNGLAGRYLERGAGEIVFAGRITGIDAERIAVGIVDLLDVQAAKLAVGTRVAKAPGKLLTQYLDAQRIGRRFGEMYCGPDARPGKHESNEKQRRRRGPKRFESIVPVRVLGYPALVTVTDDDPSQGSLRQKEDDARHPKRDSKLGIVCLAVLGNRGWKPPIMTNEDVADDYRKDPDYRTEQHGFSRRDVAGKWAKR